MLIGVDARLIGYRRGIGNFVYSLLTELAKLPGDEDYILYVDDSRAARCAPGGGRFRVKSIPPRVYPCWEQFVLPLAATHDGIDILHCPANTAPLLLPRRVRLALTIHDVMYALPTSLLPKSPSAYQRLGRVYYRVFAAQAAKRANCIMTDSEHSRGDIARYLGASRERVCVVYGAGNPACAGVRDPTLVADVKKRNGLSGRYVLALGALDTRKNTVRVLESFARLRGMLASPLQLVIVGLSREARRHFEGVVAAMRLENDARLLNFVAEEELVALYNGADVFIYPTLYEGFGMPVLEAMACGTPVITSAVGSIPEIAGNAARFVDPLRPDEIAQAMVDILTDGGRREAMVAAGLAQAARFSWARTAEQVLDLYRGCVA